MTSASFLSDPIPFMFAQQFRKQEFANGLAFPCIHPPLHPVDELLVDFPHLLRGGEAAVVLPGRPDVL